MNTEGIFLVMCPRRVVVLQVRVVRSWGAVYCMLYAVCSVLLCYCTVIFAIFVPFLLWSIL
jgi:hypothetical protein